MKLCFHFSSKAIQITHWTPTAFLPASLSTQDCRFWISSCGTSVTLANPKIRPSTAFPPWTQAGSSSWESPIITLPQTLGLFCKMEVLPACPSTPRQWVRVLGKCSLCRKWSPLLWVRSPATVPGTPSAAVPGKPSWVSFEKLCILVT